MAIPQKFRKRAEASIATYDFFDIATGIGYKILYGFGENRTGGSQFVGTSYAITANPVYSDPIFTKVNNGNTDAVFTQVISKTFDMDIDKSLIIEGKCILTIPCAEKRVVSNGNTSMFASAAILKVSGSTSTILAQASSAVLTSNLSLNANAGQVFTFNHNISRVKFKDGDKLRLVSEVWGDSGGGRTEYMMGHDPQNRGSTSNDPYPSQTSKMEIHLPLVVDL